MAKEQFDNLMKWRCIGPFRGGRVVAVAGDTGDRNVFYFGACAGGVWKTTDGGTYWSNVSDGYFNTSAIGALEVAPSDPNVIYAGTGETAIRIDVSHGDGVYKSTDAGKSWTHIGLSDTRYIAKIRVHPQNPDIVYVAALGHAFGPNAERGVYKSVDGGQTWKQVLFKSDKAGGIDLSIDFNNPRILYAATWETYRNFWHMSSGGDDSSLFRSLDGGDSWQEIKENPGLPDGIWGKVGVAASPARSGRVWALIENEDGGLYRSDDMGETWTRVSDKSDLLSRAWYYVHVTADPQDEDTVYVNNLRLWKSTDGGRNLDELGTPHGDNHDLWIDPNDNRRMVQGNDGGANVSYNGGDTWSTIYNQPTAQIYRLDTDNQKPYRVYGTQQDNSSISVPSRSYHSTITWADNYLAGTGESGWIAVKPDDPDILYVGAIGSSPGGGNALQRYDHRIRQIRLVTTWPRSKRGYGDEDLKYRFAWTYPILFSRHDSNKLFAGGNHIFQTTDEGQSWQMISPDLSHNDLEKQGPSGGPINREPGAAETYATVFALDESYFEAGVLWAGTDDGLVHLTRDGGENWENITPPDLPELTMIHCLEASPHDAASAYLAGTRYKLDDNTPYLYKTKDYGKSWQRITGGMPDDDFTRVIRADPDREGLLYAGTETGLYISFDDGDSWRRFQLNLPVVPIYDLKVKDGDLVAATHGRSFWILDDLTPLYQYHDEIQRGAVHLFKPRQTVRVMPFVFEREFRGASGKNYMPTLGLVAAFTETTDEDGITERHYYESGKNPPKGALITYYLAEAAAEPISLAFSDREGNLIRRFRSKTAEDAKKDDDGGKNGPFVPAQAGWNRFVWDLRHADVSKINGDDAAAQLEIKGAMVAPGEYQVTLKVGDESRTESFPVVKEPTSEATQADLEEQFSLWQKINEKCEETVAAINQSRDLREQLAGWQRRLAKLPEGESLASEAEALAEQVLAIESELAVPDLRTGWTDGTNVGLRLLEQLASLPSVVGLGNYRPTDQSHEAFVTMSQEIDVQLGELQALVDGELAAFNQKARDAGIPVILTD
jgi:photosystem II stability/assembly factor-like uncharacterized protein